MGNCGPGQDAKMYGVTLTGIGVPFTGIRAVVGGAFVGLGLWGDLGALLIAAFLVLITPLMLQGRRRSRSPTRFSAAV